MMGKQRVIDPTDAYDVHLGMGRFDATDMTVLGTLKGAGALGHSRREVFVDGDGWEAWGEAPYQDVNDGETLHVVVRLLTLPDAILFLDKMTTGQRSQVGPYGHLLVPSVQGETLGAVTSAADWSKAYYLVSRTERRTLNAVLPEVV